MCVLLQRELNYLHTYFQTILSYKNFNIFARFLTRVKIEYNFNILAIRFSCKDQFSRSLYFSGTKLLGDQISWGPNEIGDHFSCSRLNLTVWGGKFLEKSPSFNATLAFSLIFILTRNRDLDDFL